MEWMDEFLESLPSVRVLGGVVRDALLLKEVGFVVKADGFSIRNLILCE